MHYSEELVKQILLKQQNDKSKHIMIVMHDCIPIAVKMKDHKYLYELLTNNTEYNISYILGIQFMQSMINELNTFDYIFFQSEDFVSNLKRIYSYYEHTDCLPFDLFRKTFNEWTNDYGSLVVRKTKESYCFKSSDMENSVMIPNTELNVSCEMSMYSDKYVCQSNKIINMDNSTDSDSVNTSTDAMVEFFAKPSRRFKAKKVMEKIIKCNQIVVSKLDSGDKLLLGIIKCNIEIAKKL